MENKDTITAGTDKRYCVYLYTFPDGMFYYGKSSVEGLKERHRKHAYSCYDIGVWIRRWRLKGVEVKPVPVEFFGSEGAALARERDLIEETDAVNKGLNMCEGGGQPPVLRGDKNPMSCPKVRANHLAAVRTPAYRAKMSARAKVSANNPMKRPEVRAKFLGANNPMKRPEARAKVSKGMKRRYENPAERAKQSAAVKKAMKRPEVRAKLSANNPMMCPKARAWLSANNPMKRPEVAAKQSVALKRYWAARKREMAGVV